MYILLSPSKTQDYNFSSMLYEKTSILFPYSVIKLVDQLKKLDELELSKLLKISPKLASKTSAYYKQFNIDQLDSNAKQALFAYQGDVYESLEPTTLKKSDVDYLQEHLLIISGLYGLVRPLDLIQAYRLEMGSKLYTDNQVLYKYWSNIITDKLNELGAKNNNSFIINLASVEYSQAIVQSKLKAKFINISFTEYFNNKYQTVGIYAKKARGKMTRFLAVNNISQAKDIKNFDYDGYKFASELSSEDTYVFTRNKPS